MKNISLVLFFISNLVFSVPLPESAKIALNSLPAQSLTLDLILGRALLKANMFQRSYVKATASEISSIRTRAMFATNVFAETNITKNKNLNAVAVIPNIDMVYGAKVGVRKNFLTGTSLTAQLQHQDLQYSTGIADYQESTISISVEQDLLKNRFGHNSKRLLAAAENDSNSIQASSASETEQLSLQLIKIYYNAWISKQEVEFAQSSLQNQQKLFKITRLKYSRGTAEKNDLIQVKSAKVNAENNLLTAQQNFQKLWSQLVIMLKLPMDWLGIDSFSIPVSVDDPVKTALLTCEKDIDLKNNPIAKSQELKFKSAKLRKESLKTIHLPELKAYLAINSNGIDNSRISETFAQAITIENPSYTVGLKLNWDTSGLLSLAEKKEKMIQASIDESLAEDALLDLKYKQFNSCQELQQSVKFYSSLQNNLSDQKKRQSQEFRRFNMGLSTAFSVLQAQTDYIQSQRVLASQQVKNNVLSWEVHQLSGELSNYIKKVKTKFKDLKLNF